MKIVVWLVEGTWRSSVDAIRHILPADADITLLCVVDDEVSMVTHGAFAGLIGRGGRDRDPGLVADDMAARGADELLAQARERLAHPCVVEVRTGRVEREVVTAADGADLLVVARDGDRQRLGPKSLGHASRFVVDHAPCAVLLIWPESTPDLETIPPPPRPPPEHPPPPPPPGH